MSIATYNLTVRCTGGGEALPGATVEARLTRPDYTADGGNFPISQRATADENGVAVLALASNLVGTQDSRYTVVVRTATGQFLDSREIQMPEADTTLAQLVEQLPVNTDTQTAAAISADLAEAWATGTEPGGAGTQSSREEAERAEAAADVLPDPVGQDAGLGVQTDGADGFAVTPYSADQILRATRAQIGFHPDIWLAWDDCRPPIAANTLIDDPSVTLSSGHSWQRVSISENAVFASDTTEFQYRTDGFIRGTSSLAETAHIIAGVNPVYVDLSFFCASSSSTRQMVWMVKYIDSENFLYVRVGGSSVQISKIEGGVSSALASQNTLNGVRRAYNESPVEWRIQLLKPSVDNLSVRVFESGSPGFDYEMTDAEESVFGVAGPVGFYGRFNGHKIYGVSVREGGNLH